MLAPGDEELLVLPDELAAESELVPPFPDAGPDLAGVADLLPQLANRRRLEGLARFQAAARRDPADRHVIEALDLLQQHAPAAVDEHHARRVALYNPNAQSFTLATDSPSRIGTTMLSR